MAMRIGIRMVGFINAFIVNIVIALYMWPFIVLLKRQLTYNGLCFHLGSICPIGSELKPILIQLNSLLIYLCLPYYMPSISDRLHLMQYNRSSEFNISTLTIPTDCVCVEHLRTTVSTFFSNINLKFEERSIAY